jgi:hypothetical protein
MLPPEAAEAAVAETTEAVEAHGGTVEFTMVTSLILARRH